MLRTTAIFSAAAPSSSRDLYSVQRRFLFDKQGNEAKLSVWLQVLKSHGLISNDKKADRMMQKQLDFDQSRAISMEALHRLVDEMEHNE